MLKVGIIGTGVIATQMIKEAQQNKHIDVIAVVARDYSKTQEFAHIWNIPYAYETVEKLLENQEIEAVYIATLHPTHAMYSLQALKKHKHVLCEKPAAIKPWQLEQILAMAKQNNKLYQEAMTIGFHPLYQDIKQQIQDGAIGEITHIESSFGGMSKKEHKHSAKLAGGCIYDIGIYNLFLVYDLLGKVESIQAQHQLHKIWDVVGTVQILMKHTTGGQSYSYMTLDSISSNRATIIGTKGTIEIGKGWTVPKEYTMTLADGSMHTTSTTDAAWLGHELEAFYQTIKSGAIESTIMSHQTSLALQQIIEEIYQIINIEVEQDAIFM